MRTRRRRLLVLLAALLPLSFEVGDWMSGRAADGKTKPDRRSAIQHVAPRPTVTVPWALGRSVRLPGRVSVDEARVHRLHAVTRGCIDEVGPATPGTMVNKGEILATYSAPGVATLLLDFINTVESCEKLKERSGRDHDARVGNQLAAYEHSIATTRHTLLELGMPAEQVDRVKTTLEFAWLVEIRSPVSGMVLARNVSNEQWFGPSTELYTIADLRRVWILAEAPESDARRLKPGARAWVTHPDLAEAVVAQVSRVLPSYGPTTRTVTVRLEAANPGFVLRPDMIVNVELPVEPGPAPGVPDDSAIDAADARVRVGQGTDGIASGRTTRPASVPSGSRTTARSS